MGCPAQEGRAQETSRETGGRTRDGFFREVETAGFLGRLYGGKITIDGARFGGKVIFQALAEALQAGWKFEAAAAHNDAIIDIRHRRPLKLAAGKIVERSAQRGYRILKLADVMDTNIPGVARAIEAVGVTACRVVALEHQNFLAGVFG